MSNTQNHAPHEIKNLLDSVADENASKSPTMVDTLQDKVSALVEAPAEILQRELNSTSHELAHQTPETRGAAQTDIKYSSTNNDEAVTNIGWHKPNSSIPDPLISGYTNGELFSLIRRFNKVRLLPL